MRFTYLISVAAAALSLLAACQPALNWRDVQMQGTPLKVQLPCKPDRASRAVVIAGQSLQLQVAGCDAAGATFAVMLADLPQPLAAGAVLAQWRQATLLNMRASQVQDTAFAPAGALRLTQSVQTQAQGLQPGQGTAVQARAVWFSNGAQVFHAVVYAPQLAPEAAEGFFSSLALVR